jgi:hypothetical protein
MGLIAVGALSACRTDAGTAVFVGNHSISEAQVDKAVADLPAGVIQNDNDARNLMASTAAFNEVAKRLAKDKGYGTATPTSEELTSFGAQYKLTPAQAAKNSFIVTYAQALAWRDLLLSKMPNKAPTEAGLMEAYANLAGAGAITPGTSYATVKPEIAGIQGIGQAIELQSEMDATAKRYDITVNPRFVPSCSKAPCAGLTFPLLEVSSTDGSQTFEVLFFNMGTSTNPVVLDSPAPPQPAATS